MTANLSPGPTLNRPTICHKPNGLTLIAEQMPVEAVSLNLWFGVGSVLEADAINGMAHFLEHIIFKGTSRLPGGEFERAIESRGAVTNAATSQEYTHFYITTAPQDFASLAPLLFELVFNPTIALEAFERERLVVLEEIRRSGDNPGRRTYQQVMETCFSGLPYRRPVLGTTATIEQLSSQQMRDFHSQWYRPENLTAAVVGNLPVTDLIKIVQDAFAWSQEEKINQKSFVLPTVHQWQPEPPFQDIVRLDSVDSRLQQARLVMMWRVPGMDQLEKTYPLDVLAAILGQGRMSRLFQDLRENRQWVTSIGASNVTHQLQGIFQISAQLATENIEKVETAILEHISRFQQEPIALSDLARLRTQVTNRFIFGNEKPSDRANLYGYYQSQLGTLEPAFNYTAIISAIEPEDVQKAAQEYLNTQAYGIVIIRPV